MAAKKPTKKLDPHLNKGKTIRATDEQWALWNEAADHAERNLNDWIRVGLSKLAKEELSKKR